MRNSGSGKQITDSFRRDFYMDRSVWKAGWFVIPSRLFIWNVWIRYSFCGSRSKPDYFEDLIQKYLLDNAHGAVVVVAPEKGLNRAKEQALAEKLAAYKAGLSDAEVQALIAQTRHLREYQEEPSKEEDLLKIPMLGREDMKKEAMPFSNKEENMGEIPVVRHEAPANGIDYITLMFECNDIAEEEVPYLGLLARGTRICQYQILQLCRSCKCHQYLYRRNYQWGQHVSGSEKSRCDGS